MFIFLAISATVICCYRKGKSLISTSLLKLGYFSNRPTRINNEKQLKLLSSEGAEKPSNAHCSLIIGLDKHNFLVKMSIFITHQL